MQDAYYNIREGGLGVYLGECLPKGMSAQRRWCLTGGSVCPAFLTHALENITFPQLLLRAVNMASQLEKEIFCVKHCWGTYK